MRYLSNDVDVILQALDSIMIEVLRWIVPKSLEELVYVSIFCGELLEVVNNFVYLRVLSASGEHVTGEF